MADTGTILDEQVRAAARGSQADRDLLLQAIAPRVRAMIIIRLAPTPAQFHAVDDLSQQVLLGIAEGLERLKSDTAAGLRAFASRIAANKVADYLRRLQTPGGMPQNSLESSVRDLSASMAMKDLLPAMGRTVLSDVARTEAIGGILDALSKMNDRDREVITLAFFDQLGSSQIAEQMGLSRAAASMVLVRAVRALRRMITGSSKLGSIHVKRT